MADVLLQVVEEFIEHGTIENSLLLLDYGARLNNCVIRNDCSLSDILASIREAVSQQVQSFTLGDHRG